MIKEVLLRDVFAYHDAAGRSVNAHSLRASDGWVFGLEQGGVMAALGYAANTSVVFPFSAVKRWITGPDPAVAPTESPNVLKPKGGKK